jgi:hypothetical protein
MGPIELGADLRRRWGDRERLCVTDEQVERLERSCDDVNAGSGH